MVREESEPSNPLISALPEPQPANGAVSVSSAANIAQAVKQARLQSDLTPQAISQLVPSCSSGLIAYIEAGFKKPTPEIAKALALAMNVDPAEFLAFLD